MFLFIFFSSLYTLAKECNLEELTLETCPFLTGKALHDFLLTSKCIKTLRVRQCPKIAKATVIKGLVDPKFVLYFNNKRIDIIN